MKIFTVNRRKTTCFSELANQINDNQKALQKYIQFPFSIANFKPQMELKEKSYTSTQRTLLTAVLRKQMSAYLKYDKVSTNIELLKEENTFTITSGHQLNLYGGPLYLIYKIMDAIRLAEKLSVIYPDKNFVPLFWMATEDHDFEEINHLHLFNETLEWESHQEGPVGRFDLTGIQDFKNKILDKFSNNPDFAAYLNQFYTNGNLAEATTEFLMSLLRTH